MQKKTRTHVWLISVVALGLLAVSLQTAFLPASPASATESGFSSTRSLADDPRVALRLVTSDVLEGGDIFFRGTFEGNGRSCGTCHPPENNLVVDPKFIETLPDDNPLFVAERPQEINPSNDLNLENLEIPFLLRNHGLIFENVDGFEAPGTKFMMRSVPHTLSLATSITPPDDPGVFAQRTGWSGDGAPNPGGLRDFITGAVIQHYTRNFEVRDPGLGCGPNQDQPCFRLPTEEELNKVEAFLLRTGRLKEINLAAVELTNEHADRGRKIFQNLGAAEGLPNGKCFGCHNNAGANFASGVNGNINTGIELVRLEILGDGNPGCSGGGFIDPDSGDVRCIPFDGGFGGQNLPNPNFDTDGDGILDSFGNGTFNAPPLVEAADTGPFFHTNGFETIEQAVRFYSSETFANSPGGALVQMVFGEGINLNSQQNKDVAAFLRVINAAFNLAIAIQRIEAAVAIEAEYGLDEHALTNQLLSLAIEELQDARKVLSKSNLDSSARTDIKDASKDLRRAIKSRQLSKRRDLISSAMDLAAQAKDSLGTGLDFELGQGNLVF